MQFIMLEMIAIICDVAVALLDLMLRRAGRRYDHSVHVRAPRDIVWAVASARNITLDGSPPIVIKALPSPQPGVEVLQVRTGGLTCRIGLRALERREGVGEIHAVVPEHTDHLAVMAGVTTSGFALIDVPGGTRLTMFQAGRQPHPLRGAHQHAHGAAADGTPHCGSERAGGLHASATEGCHAVSDRSFGPIGQRQYCCRLNEAPAKCHVAHAHSELQTAQQS